MNPMNPINVKRRKNEREVNREDVGRYRKINRKSIGRMWGN
jgi:hypothetical protein